MFMSILARSRPTSCCLPPAGTFTDDTVLAIAVADCLLNGFDYITSTPFTNTLWPIGTRGIVFVLSLGQCWRAEPVQQLG